MFQSINPYTNCIIGTITEDDNLIVLDKLDQATAAQPRWRAQTIEERCNAINSIAEVLSKRQETLAAMATAEMGKHIREARAEIEKCVHTLQYYATHGAAILADKPILTEASKSYITYNPLGTVLAIMPWNFPYWQVFRAMGPILLSGNAMVLKHASNVMQCAELIASVVADSDVPQGLFQLLKVKSSAIESIIAHPVINAVTLTGSTKAGSAVASVAAGHIKKQVLELGGSDAYLILHDADIALAAAICVKSRMQNAGQSCISAKRIIVVSEVYDAFHEALLSSAKQISYGDPHDEQITIGPMVSTAARDELHSQVLTCLEQGAQISIGGFIPEGDNSLYPPTILTDITPGMPAWEDELFGPVFILIKATDEAHAIAIANAHQYGLGGGVCSQDVNRAEYIAAHLLDTGFVAVNDYARSDARLPFGGIKQSGYGRELAHLGVHEFCNVKTVVVK